MTIEEINALLDLHMKNTLDPDYLDYYRRPIAQVLQKDPEDIKVEKTEIGPLVDEVSNLIKTL